MLTIQSTRTATTLLLAAGLAGARWLPFIEELRPTGPLKLFLTRLAVALACRMWARLREADRAAVSGSLAALAVLVSLPVVMAPAAVAGEMAPITVAAPAATGPGAAQPASADPNGRPPATLAPWSAPGTVGFGWG
jgi:ABC-type uncharacterized transport system permease subunit